MNLAALKTDILKALENGATPIAAFDADGTLWSCDMGENFLHYKAQKKLLPNLPKDPWAHYENMKTENLEKAYLWLAQILDGTEIGQVRQWAQEAFDQMLDQLGNSPSPVFPIVKELIEFLKSNNVKIYIVTASIRWAVEPGAKYLGVSHEDVIGITTKIVDGKVTAEQDGPLTYKEGKPKGLFLKTENKNPFFAAGNTEGDLALLKSASHIRLVNVSAKPDEENYKTERFMVNVAKENHWHIFDHLNP